MGSTANDKSGSPSEVAKIDEKRAGEIALAALRCKYRKNGFDMRRERLDTWLDNHARETGILRPDLLKFVMWVILPAVGNTSVELPSDARMETVENTALRLLYLDCTNLSRLDAQIVAFVRTNATFKKEEVVSLVIHYLIPHYVDRLTR